MVGRGFISFLGNANGLFSRQKVEFMFVDRVNRTGMSANKLFAAFAGWVSQCAAWNQAYSSVVHIHVSECWYETPSFANVVHGFVLGLSIV